MKSVVPGGTMTVVEDLHAYLARHPAEAGGALARLNPLSSARIATDATPCAFR